MKRTWWKEAVVYQIYPRSFKDSNGDGIGDLQGIISKLDYLKELGIDVIWLSPVYQSPNADNGYDISNYQDIMEEFGTMEDLDDLLKGIHDRGMKLVMDLILNHTSDEHPWFLEAKKSKDNPYHDYYIWRDGEEGVLPNNWESHFSGSVWEWNEDVKQYYLHIFAKKQPDLNWENPKVRNEAEKIAAFWLEKGIDGFRLDVINFISKTDGFPSVEGARGLVRGNRHYMNGPRVHEYIHELSKNVFSRYDIMTVGETPNVTPQIAAEYVADERQELNMVFQFEHMSVDSGSANKWDIVPWNTKKLKQILSKWQTEMSGKGWNSLYLCNHDQPRSVSRFGNDAQFHGESAKMLATLIHTQQGTPYVYQGEEIGMTNVRFEDLSDYRDIQIKNLEKDLLEKGYTREEILKKVHYRGRDNARTPMQWSQEANAGFSEAEPWIKVNPNYTRINVAAQEQDENSILNYYKKLIALRKKEPVIVYGGFEEYEADRDDVYVYKREDKKTKLLVILNLKEQETAVSLPASIDPQKSEILIGNYLDQSPQPQMKLRPYEAVVLKEESSCQ